VVADLIVQWGTLSVGDILVAGSAYGRVRQLFDDTGKPLNRYARNENDSAR
jgi:translation initiation factor IF-2